MAGMCCTVAPSIARRDARASSLDRVTTIRRPFSGCEDLLLEDMRMLADVMMLTR